MITIDVIYRFLGSLLLTFCNAFGNYGWAILTFGLIVKLIMLPFQMKTKRSSLQTMLLQPRVKELEKRHKGNPQKYQEEVSKLYRDAKVNPMSGCLWTLLPFPIVIILYRAVRMPLSYMMNLAAAEQTTLTELLSNLGYYVMPTGRASVFEELKITEALHTHFQEIVSSSAVAEFAGKLKDINFNWLGLNLADTPSLNFWANGLKLAGFLLFLVPLVSAGLSVLQIKVGQAMQPPQDEKAAQSAKTMNLMMPLMSLWICFSMPAVMGIYWIEQSVLGIVQDLILNKIYKKKLDSEMSEFLAAERAREAELERKRAETERLKAEGKTQVNTNTSKRRLAAQERNAEDLRQAALRAADRAARGLEDSTPPSQVGTRRFARGRAYDPERFDAADTPEAESSAEE